VFTAELHPGVIHILSLERLRDNLVNGKQVW